MTTVQEGNHWFLETLGYSRALGSFKGYNPEVFSAVNFGLRRLLKHQYPLDPGPAETLEI